MKTNLVDLMSKVSQLETDFRDLGYELRNQYMNVTIIELDGKEQKLEYYPDFEKDFERYIEMANEITQLKGIIFERNNSLRLENGNTIQKTIAEIQHKRKILYFAKELAKQSPSKTRTSETNNSYFTSRELAYDKNAMVDFVQKLTTEIQDLELEISKLNAEEFEI